MGKVLIVVLISLAFIAQGCEAFKSHYDSPATGEESETLAAPGEGEAPPANEGEEEEKPVEGGGEVTIDYGQDEAVCENMENVAAAVVEAPAELVNDGWTAENGEEFKVTAEKIGLFTTSIAISNDAGDFKFTVKQTGDETFNICDMSLSGCPVDGCFAAGSIWSAVESGTIDIYKFNEEGEEGVVLNAGHYIVQFGQSNMGDEGISLEGSYMTDALSEPAAEAEEVAE